MVLQYQVNGWFFSTRERDGSSVPGKGIVLQYQEKGWFFSTIWMVLQYQGKGWFFSTREGDCSSVPGKGMVLQYHMDCSSVPGKGMVLQYQGKGWFFSTRKRVACAQMDPNQFLIALLNKFELMNWIDGEVRVSDWGPGGCGFEPRPGTSGFLRLLLFLTVVPTLALGVLAKSAAPGMSNSEDRFGPGFEPTTSRAPVRHSNLSAKRSRPVCRICYVCYVSSENVRKEWRLRTSLARHSHCCTKCKSVVPMPSLAVSGCVHCTLRKWDVTEKGSSATDVSAESTRDLLRFTNSLVEEFLNLLIIIMGERYVPGVGQVCAEDMVKREVIHQLCISPMAHSDLSKALPENHKHETGMEAVMSDVSTFKKPGVTGMGRYELKAEFYKDYNPFFYHYTRADQSKARSEEAQLKRKKQEGESTACPPPEMPALSKEFSSLVNVLECDVFVHTIRTVFRRVNSSRSRSWTEAMVHRALHLVGMALNEEKRLYQTSPYIRFNFVKKATEGGSCSLYAALHDLLGKPRIQNHADLLTWVIDRFDEVKALKEQKPGASDAQKAKKVSSKSKTDAERKKKAEAARKRREKILAQMSDMQKSFIRDNLELFEATGTDLSSSPSMEVEGSPLVVSSQHPVAVGPDRSPATHVTLTTSTCILCQEDQEVSAGNKCVVLAAYVQRSTALSKSRGKGLEDPDKYDPLLVSPDLYHGVHTSTCGHVMHADCWQRFYEAIVAKEQRRTMRFRHILSYEVDRGEFLCPLCETLSNTVIPILPPSTTIQPDTVSADISLSFSDWLDGLQKTVEASQQAVMKEEEDKMESSDDLPVLSPCPLPSITKNMAEMAAQGFQQLFEYMTETGAQAQYSDSVKEMMKLFSRATYTNMLHDPPLPTKASDSAATYFWSVGRLRPLPTRPGQLGWSTWPNTMFGLGLDPNDDDDRVPMTAWGTCAYTIRTLAINQLEQWTVKNFLFCSDTSRYGFHVNLTICDTANGYFETKANHCLDPFPPDRYQPDRTSDRMTAEGRREIRSAGGLGPRADCITALVRVVSVSGNLSDPQTISKSALRLLSALLPQEPMKNIPCILDLDMFFTLVFLHVTIPSLYCNENTAAGGTIRGVALNDKHLLHLVTAAHLVQILLAANFSSADAPMDTEETAEGSAWVKLFMAVRKEAGVQTAVVPSGWQLQIYIRESVLPFLRCTALFFHCHTGVQSPAELQESGVSEFEPLCQYLALPPDLSSLLQQTSGAGEGHAVPQTIHSKWCRYPGVKESLASGPASLVKYPVEVNKLVPLPQDYSDVINRGSVFTCPRSDGDDSRAPTMCLVCGQMLCSQSYCCQTDLDGEPVGACTAHIYTCGAGVGIFLRWVVHVWGWGGDIYLRWVVHMWGWGGDIYLRWVVHMWGWGGDIPQVGSTRVGLGWGYLLRWVVHVWGWGGDIYLRWVVHMWGWGGDIPQGEGVPNPPAHRQDKGCFYPSPYLDDYGEHDQGLRANITMTICQLEVWRKAKSVGSRLGIADDIEGRIQLANLAMKNMWHMWGAKAVSLELKLKLFHVYVLPVLLYNAGTWGLTEQVASKIDRWHRKQLRRLAGYYYPNCISNSKHYKKCKASPLHNEVHRRRWTLFGHILRMPLDSPAQKALNIALSKKLTPRRGRPRGGLLDCLVDDVKLYFHQNVQTAPYMLKWLREQAADKARWNGTFKTIDERYKKLQKMWLAHSIPEEVVHFMEANASFATIEWQHL
ncbi:E3 ubiquitin-protein ligase ubr1 [Branchiostoma belcheri]|nr:E3 ubiquitin-protein ligase ubr1 [Branchiostoma belcheri]